MKKKHPLFLSSVNLRDLTNHDNVIEELLLVPLVWVALLVMMCCYLLSNILRNIKSAFSNNTS